MFISMGFYPIELDENDENWIELGTYDLGHLHMKPPRMSDFQGRPVALPEGNV